METPETRAPAARAKAIARPGSCTRGAISVALLATSLAGIQNAFAQNATATAPAAQESASAPEPVPDLETLLALARQGHPVAQFNLGVKYDFGQGVTKDPEQAVHWYRMAAAQGHGGAQFNLAGMYFEGLGVQRDLLRATMWFTLSAEAGVGGAAKNRAILSRALNPEQQAQARAMALQCRQREFKDCEP